MTRPGDRAIAAALATVSLGLIAAIYAVWIQAAQVKDNRDLLRQQQTTVNQLLAQSEQDRREQAQLRSLVLRLQQQVRDLGGIPATLPPQPSTTPAPAATGPAGPSPQPTRAGQRTPAPTSPTPRPSRTPVSPTPRPSCVVPLPTPNPICGGF